MEETQQRQLEAAKAPAGRSKYNGGRDFRQHAYSQHHNMLPCLQLPLPEQMQNYLDPQKLKSILYPNYLKGFRFISGGNVGVLRSGNGNVASYVKTMLSADFSV